MIGRTNATIGSSGLTVTYTDYPTTLITEKWTTKALMPTSRYGLTSSVADNSICY